MMGELGVNLQSSIYAWASFKGVPLKRNAKIKMQSYQMYKAPSR
jgi:hypothetical protein